MYGISRTQMINPAHIVVIDYRADEVVGADGVETGAVTIQMSNQSGQTAYVIKSTCDQCEMIVNDLIAIVKGINSDDSVEGDEFTLPGFSIN